MFRRLHIILFLFIVLLTAGPAAVEAAAAAWERVEVLRVDPSDDERIEIEVRDSYIYLSTNKPVTVKIFTILGQMVAQDKLPAGISRIKLAQRGMYILKAGSVTRRVNI